MGDRRQNSGRRAEDAIRTEMMWDILDWETSEAKAFMSLAEQGALRNIFDQLYKAGGKLLNDERVWWRASGASCKEEWDGIAEQVKKEFEISADGKWFSHHRVSEQISKVLMLLKKRRAAGKAGGEARAKQMGKQPLPIAIANDKQVPKQMVSPILTVPILTVPNQEEKALVAKATRKQLPDDFRPKDHHKNLAERLSVCLEDEFEKFRDFHKAKGNVMKDWDLAFNTWLRNTRQYGGRNGKQDFGAKISRAVQRLASEDAGAD